MRGGWKAPSIAIAQALRPAGSVQYSPTRNWSLEGTVAYSRNMGFHVYDAVQSSFAVSYGMPVGRAFKDGGSELLLALPSSLLFRTAAGELFQFHWRKEPAVQTVYTDQPVLKDEFAENDPMKICLVATFPPSGRQLNEYAFHIARELRRNPMIHLTILADELADYQFATDGDGKPVSSKSQTELPGFDVVRCWKFNDLTTPVRLLRAIRKCQPDIVWFNLVFSSFATQDHPVAAFAGLSVPGTHPRHGLPHPRHASSHHRARGFRQRRSQAGKTVSPGQRHGYASAAEGALRLGSAFGLPAHPGEKVFGAECSARHPRRFRTSSRLRLTFRCAEIPINAFWPSGTGERTSASKL